MRTLLLATAAILALGGAAFAQNATGNPKSSTASNIDKADTHSTLAPALPSAGATGTPDQYLMRAEHALKANRTGEAQEALERAETRLLDRSTAPDAASQPDLSPRVDAIRKARMALAHRNKAGAMSAIQMAMGQGSAEGAPPVQTEAPPLSTGTVLPPAPAGSGPASGNGVAVNPAGGTNGTGGNSVGSVLP